MPSVEHDAGRPAVLGDHVVDRAPRAGRRAERLGRPLQHLGEAAVAALVEAPGAVVAVLLAHQVEEQHQPGALRHRADLVADDAGRRDGRP